MTCNDVQYHAPPVQRYRHVIRRGRTMHRTWWPNAHARTNKRKDSSERRALTTSPMRCTTHVLHHPCATPPTCSIVHVTHRVKRNIPYWTVAISQKSRRMLSAKWQYPPSPSPNWPTCQQKPRPPRLAAATLSPWLERYPVRPAVVDTSPARGAFELADVALGAADVALGAAAVRAASASASDAVSAARSDARGGRSTTADVATASDGAPAAARPALRSSEPYPSRVSYLRPSATRHVHPSRPPRMQKRQRERVSRQRRLCQRASSPHEVTRAVVHRPLTAGC
jgi:hypothetical protein